jgi:hypothetical protein
MTQPAIKRREFSLRSMLLGAVFIVTFIVAIFIDLAALLQYFNLVSWLPPTTLEMGAAITAATVVPLLVMGMSISADGNKYGANKAVAGNE